MANKVKVNICGKEYTVVSEENHEYVLQIAHIVDQKIQEVTERNPALNPAMATVLAALNLADETEKIKAVAREKVNAQAAEIAALKKQVDEQRKPFPSGEQKNR